MSPQGKTICKNKIVKTENQAFAESKHLEEPTIIMVLPFSIPLHGTT